MTKQLLFIWLLIFSFVAYAQDAKEILQHSYNKCQSIQNGYYEMTRHMKTMSKKDTSRSSFHCYFKKLKDDSLYSSAFHYKSFWKNEYSGDAMYTGEDFATINIKDSTASIMSKTLWANEIKSNSHNYKFYSPLTSTKSSPLQHDSAFMDQKYNFKYTGEEVINGVLCHHIVVNQKPENDSAEMMQLLKTQFQYWISKLDFIPIQYSVSYDIVMNNDTMYQYEKNILEKYELNHLKDDINLTLNSIPSYYKLKEYTPHKSPDPLPNDTIAPNWELLSLKDEKISLKSLLGQVVLLDFFYKSCYPCMQALPALQALNEKYKNKGLRIIGIDPYDEKEDDIPAFLAKRGVTYTVLLGGKDVAKNYRVSGYPTIYIIDKSGKIIFNQVGYGKGVDETLDEIIRKNL